MLNKKFTKVLILLYGFAASGKTNTALELSKQTGWSLFTKDSIQEMIYDNLGTGDSQWRKSAAKLSYSVINVILDQVMPQGIPIIIEANLNKQFDFEWYSSAEKKYGYKIYQIRCGAEPEVLLQRLIARANQPGRHPGHGDIEKLPILQEQFKQKYPLALSSEWPLTDFDTNVLSNEIITRFISSYLQNNFEI